MAAGLFGKLPAKRDFVAARARRRFLDVWEPWLQGGLAESRAALGENWVDAYNRAPIWRFWLAADFCGEPILGAFMSSVDGVGRAFPLTIFSTDGADPAPPGVDANIPWFDAAELILLDALDPANGFDVIAEAAADLPPPAATKSGRGFTEKVVFDSPQALAARSFWWTIGGEDYPPLAFAAAGMPQAARFSDMLTGRLVTETPTREENALDD